MKLFMLYQIFGYVITIALLLYAWNSWRFCVKDLNQITNNLKQNALKNSHYYKLISESVRLSHEYSVHWFNYDIDISSHTNEFKAAFDMLYDIKKCMDDRIDHKFDTWIKSTMTDYFGETDTEKISHDLKLYHGFGLYIPGHLFGELAKHTSGLCSLYTSEDTKEIIYETAKTIIYDSYHNEINAIYHVAQYCKTNGIDVLPICHMFK